MAKISKMKKQKLELPKKDIIKVNPWKKNSNRQLQELPLVKDGQVTIHSKNISTVDGHLTVRFFISNGLNRKVKFKKVPLKVVDSDKRVLAQQSFDGETIGEIASGATKSCVARFLPANVYVKDVPVECKVCFDVLADQPAKTNIQYQALPDHTTEEQKQELERVLANLPPVKRGKVSFSPLHAKVTTNNDLLATVIVRNFANKKIKLGQVPLVIFDANQEELVRGEFKIKDLTIESFKAILLTLNFGPVSKDRETDLSSWSVNVIQMNDSVTEGDTKKV